MSPANRMPLSQATLPTQKEMPYVLIFQVFNCGLNFFDKKMFQKQETIPSQLSTNQHD